MATDAIAKYGTGGKQLSFVGFLRMLGHKPWSSCLPSDAHDALQLYSAHLRAGDAVGSASSEVHAAQAEEVKDERAVVPCDEEPELPLCEEGPPAWRDQNTGAVVIDRDALIQGAIETLIFHTSAVQDAVTFSVDLQAQGRQEEADDARALARKVAGMTRQSQIYGLPPGEFDGQTVMSESRHQLRPWSSQQAIRAWEAAERLNWAIGTGQPLPVQEGEATISVATNPAADPRSSHRQAVVLGLEKGGILPDPELQADPVSIWRELMGGAPKGEARMIRQWCDGRQSPAHDPRRRYALSIGNDRYKDEVGPLNTSVRDAQSMANVLQNRGFNTYLLCNCPAVQLRQAIKTFSKRLRPGDVVAIYFSGHAVNVDCVPHFLARDASCDEPHKNSINLNELVRQCSNQNNMRDESCLLPGYMLIMLDACRATAYDNPYRAPGLSIFNFQQPSAVGYTLALSADPGTVSTPTPYSRNSLFTTMLIEAMMNDHLASSEVQNAIQWAANEVQRATGGKQVPFVQAYEREVVGDMDVRAGLITSFSTALQTDSNLRLAAVPFTRHGTRAMDTTSDSVFRDGTIIDDTFHPTLPLPCTDAPQAWLAHVQQ